MVSNAWHTGIVIARGDIPAGLMPEAADLPWARFLELGWGDADYYPEPRPGLALALAAALVPTPAVIHLVGHREAPRPLPGALEVLVLPVTATGLDRLARQLDAAFVREEGRPAEGEPSALVPGALFYPAHGRFHLLNTCNTWTARQLAAAGVPVAASGVVTAEDLMSRLRPLALPDPVPLPLSGR